MRAATPVSGLGWAPPRRGLVQAASVVPGWQDHLPEARGPQAMSTAGVCIQQVERSRLRDFSEPL